MTQHVAEKAHAELGASTASRWMACPGSVRLSKGIPDYSSEYAQEGTAAHALAELSLRKGVEPITFSGTTIEGVEVTDDMAEFVSVYVDYCRDLIRGDSAGTWIEKQFTLQHLNPPGPMFGTADFVAYNDRTRELEIVDLKYGVGVVVDPFENKQLQYYALGAVLSMPQGTPIDEVKMTIVQPRATHRDGVIRSFTMPFSDLLGFTNELMEAARATIAPDAPLNPGPHCRFCKAAGTCPAQKEQAQQVAMVEFETLPPDLPPNPELIPIPELAGWAGKFGILEDWMKAVRARLQTELEQGGSVPGYKLVQKRAVRKWADPEEAAQWLKAKGEAEADIYKTELRSVAQIEKLVGKKDLPPELWTKISSGVVMVPESDAREQVAVSAGEEFGAICPGK